MTFGHNTFNFESQFLHKKSKNKQRTFGDWGLLHSEICSQVLALSLEHSVVNHTYNLQFLS